LAEDDERPEIDSREALEKWLEGKPAEWAQAIAVRAALRVFPLVLTVFDVPDSAISQQRKLSLMPVVLRAVIVSWAARRHPVHELVAAAGAAAAYADATADTVYAAKAAAFTTRAAGFAAFAGVDTTTFAASAAADATAAAADAAFAAADARTTIWQAAAEDCDWLLELDAMGDLIDQPLWLSDARSGLYYNANVPFWVRQSFDRFAVRDEVKTGLWELIVDWYRAILTGSRSVKSRGLLGEGADLVIATQPGEFWTVTHYRSAEDILEEIAEIAGYRLPAAGRREGDTFPELIVSFLEGVGRPASLDEIRAYFATFETPPADTTIRGRLSDLARSGRIIRTAPGVYVHPKWHVEDGGTADMSEDGEAKLAHDVDETLQNAEAQAPAAYRFRWQESRLEAAPPADIASDPEGAQILLDETRRKTVYLAERLERSNADKRVLVSVEGLLSVLPQNVDDLRPALLRSRARSVEADAQAYSSSGDEEQFLYPDALAALIDLSETARDLQGYFPSLRELEAEITALAIDPSEVEAVKAQLDEIVDEAAGHPEVVGPSAVEALRTMEALATEPAPPAVRQKRIADYALVVRNSLSSIARVALDNAFSREAKQLASDVYAKARAKVVDGIADGAGAMARPATIIAIAALVGGVFGPVAGIAAAAAGFGKVDRLLKLADKWLEKWEKENTISDASGEADESREADEPAGDNEDAT
jgi:uncharacterized membrane protein YtjA (UPF0391 family)